MKYLGNTKEKIPEVGIGTWKLGVNPEKEINALRAGIDAGMRFIDTAEMYGTEWVVARAIKNEEEVFLATKVSPSHFSYNDVIKACDRSLKSLGARQIGLYQLHWPNHSVPIRETMRAMEALVDAGKIRHIGVSNFTVKEFQEAQAGNGQIRDSIQPGRVQCAGGARARPSRFLQQEQGHNHRIQPTRKG